MRNSKLATAALAVMGCFLFCLSLLGAEESSQVANKVKAGYVFNFAKFVEWPAECFQGKDSPIVVGVLGKDPIAGVIQDTLRGTTIDGHPLQVRLLPETAESIDCHLLFICASEKKRVSKIFELQKAKHILTVSDMEHFNEEGGMICLRKEGVNIRFEINQKDAEKAGLKISSKLLQLAKTGR
jgi:hypothetical protein